MSTDTDSHAVAQTIHDLGAALWFGGSVMGVAGVNKSGSDLKQGIDRVRVAGSAWNRFAPVQWAGIAATLGSGLQLTAAGKSRLALQQGFGTVGALKAALTVAGAGATAFAAYSGSRVGKIAEQVNSRDGQLEVKDASIPTSATPPELAAWQKRQRLAQFSVPVLAGAVITCNAWLVQSYRVGATTKGVLRRFLPV